MQRCDCHCFALGAAAEKLGKGHLRLSDLGCLGRLGCSVSSSSVWGRSGSTSQAAAPAVPRAVTLALPPRPARGSTTARGSRTGWERILEPWEYLHRITSFWLEALEAK